MWFQFSNQYFQGVCFAYKILPLKFCHTKNLLLIFCRTNFGPKILLFNVNQFEYVQAYTALMCCVFWPVNGCFTCCLLVKIIFSAFKQIFCLFLAQMVKKELAQKITKNIPSFKCYFKTHTQTSPVYIVHLIEQLW